MRDDDLPLDDLPLILDLRDEEYLPLVVEKFFLLMVHRHIGGTDVSRDGILVPTIRATFVAVQEGVFLEGSPRSALIPSTHPDSRGKIIYQVFKTERFFGTSQTLTLGGTTCTDQISNIGI